MSCLKNVLFWTQIVTLFVAFSMCGVGITLVDDWLVYDVVSREQMSLFRVLAFSLAVCAGLWSAIAIASCMFTAVRENDPDYDFGEYEFPDSPNKPR